MKKLYFLMALGCPAFAASAQMQVSGTLFISPGATVAVTGGDVVATTNILGTGTLLMNGNSAQYLSMNGHELPQLEVSNAANVTLASPAVINTGLVFTAGNLILDTNRITFNASSAAPTTASSAGYIVTNNTGYVTATLPAGTAFTFPVGFSVSGDYTPATVTNAAGTTRTFQARVQDNNGTSPLTGNPTTALNRIWQIYSSAAGTATVALTHNAANEGTAFTRNSAFISQQTAAGTWDVVPGTTPTAPNYTHTRTGVTIPAANGITSYFSKSSNSSVSLSAAAAVAALDVTIGLQGIILGNGTMPANLQNYSGTNTDLLPTTDPYGLNTTYAAINNTAGTAGVVVDWVKVEVRSATNPGAVLQTRALLLKPNGHIVDANGAVPAFNAQAEDVRVAVYHRNHVPVLSNALGSSTFNGTKAYDFTTALTQAANDFGDPQQMKLVVSKWCLWTGDINQDMAVDGSDFGFLAGRLAKGDDTYQFADINQDGYVDGSDFGRVNGNLSQTPISTLTNY